LTEGNVQDNILIFVGTGANVITKKAILIIPADNLSAGRVIIIVVIKVLNLDCSYVSDVNQFKALMF